MRECDNMLLQLGRVYFAKYITYEDVPSDDFIRRTILSDTSMLLGDFITMCRGNPVCDGCKCRFKCFTERY